MSIVSCFTQFCTLLYLYIYTTCSEESIIQLFHYLYIFHNDIRHQTHSLFNSKKNLILYYTKLNQNVWRRARSRGERVLGGEGEKCMKNVASIQRSFASIALFVGCLLDTKKCWFDKVSTKKGWDFRKRIMASFFLQAKRRRRRNFSQNKNLYSS